MPAPLTTLSQSSLQDYNDCPRRFELRYIQQLSYPAIETEPALENEKHLQEGEYFHRLAQQYLIGIPSEQIGRLANTPNLQRWWANFLDFGGLTSSPRGTRIVPEGGRVKGKDFKSLHPEIALSAPLGKFRLLAKYDLIGLANDNKVYIYDWKTYRKRPKNEWLHARWQTRVYRALLVKAGAHLNRGRPFEPEQIEMIYWFTDFPSEPARFDYKADQFKRDWEALTRLAEEISTASDFPLTDDRLKCSYCPYRSYCNRGARAGEAADAELETEAEELFDINFEQVGEIAF